MYQLISDLHMVQGLIMQCPSPWLCPPRTHIPSSFPNLCRPSMDDKNCNLSVEPLSDNDGCPTFVPDNKCRPESIEHPLQFDFKFQQHSTLLIISVPLRIFTRVSIWIPAPKPPLGIDNVCLCSSVALGVPSCVRSLSIKTNQQTARLWCLAGSSRTLRDEFMLLMIGAKGESNEKERRVRENHIAMPSPCSLAQKAVGFCLGFHARAGRGRFLIKWVFQFFFFVRFDLAYE